MADIEGCHRNVFPFAEIKWLPCVIKMEILQFLQPVYAFLMLVIQAG